MPAVLKPGAAVDKVSLITNNLNIQVLQASTEL